MLGYQRRCSSSTRHLFVRQIECENQVAERMLPTTLTNLITTRGIRVGVFGFRLTPPPVQWLHYENRLMRVEEFNGKSSFETCLALARRSSGADLEGYRAEFINLVEMSAELRDNGRRAGLSVELLAVPESRCR